jgi:hypothetical protein
VTLFASPRVGIPYLSSLAGSFGSLTGSPGDTLFHSASQYRLFVVDDVRYELLHIAAVVTTSKAFQIDHQHAR